MYKYYLNLWWCILYAYVYIVGDEKEGKVK